MTRITRLAATLLLAAASTASLADTQNLGVSATVTGQCRFYSTATTMSFGSVDPSSAGPISGTLGNAVTYKCTKGVTPGTLSAGDGLWNSSGRRMKDGTSGDFIPYSLTVGAATQGSGFGSGQEKTVSITASIAASDYENVSAGTYNDTVVLTVSP